jgi:hypothetical protein
MAIGSEVFGSCVGEVNISVEIENSGFWHCCEQKYLRFILASKAAQYLRWKREMVPGIGGRF